MSIIVVKHALKVKTCFNHLISPISMKFMNKLECHNNYRNKRGLAKLS